MKEIFNIVANLLIFGPIVYGIYKYRKNRAVEKENKLVHDALVAREALESWQHYPALVEDNLKRIKKYIKMSPEGPCVFVMIAIITAFFTDEDGKPTDLDISEMIDERDEIHDKQLAQWKQNGSVAKDKPELTGVPTSTVIKFLRKKTDCKKHSGLSFANIKMDAEPDGDDKTVQRLWKKIEKAHGLLIVLSETHIAVVAGAKNNHYYEAYKTNSGVDLQESDRVVAIMGFKETKPPETT